MTQALKLQEASMEKILAYIRQAVADDASEVPTKILEPAVPAAAPSLAMPPPRSEQAPALPSEPSGNETVLDDTHAGMGAPAAQPPAAAVDHASDVVESAGKIPGPGMPAAPGFQSTEGRSDVDNRAPQPASEPAAPPNTSGNAFQDRGERVLMSEATTAAIGSAFNGLAHVLLLQNARTLEDVVREMLQPLLKTWLDDNLPELVERLIRAEIERISGGRG
jgi:uncharacterized protein